MAYFIPLLVAVAMAVYVVFQRARARNRLPLPPGPKPVPLLGNFFDLPPPGDLEYEHWLKHKDLYGGISSVSVLGTTLILVHDRDVAHELLDRMASRTSGRPDMVMANTLCGYDSIVVCQGYTPTFKRYRKLLHRELGTKALSAEFEGVQEAEVDRQMVRALRRPGRWIEHLKTTSAAAVLKMAYGYTTNTQRPDVMVKLVDQIMTEFSRAAVPMAWAVDVIPALRYLPDGIPGLQFQDAARRWSRSLQAASHIPYNFVRRQMAAGTNKPSYVSKLVEKLTPGGDASALTAEDEHAVKWTAMSLYGAAADTTVITLESFTAAMVLFPEVQRKAQEEIDRVVGGGRIPTTADRAGLPYIDALVKESLRWWPVAPMGIPHVATEDVEFRGMRIPQGALILPAVWWFLHDPHVYAEPERFDPERYLEPRCEPDPCGEAFGYGRRACAGRYFAETSLLLNIVKTLAAFRFERDVDGCGREVALEMRAKPGLLLYAEPFAFRMVVRSEKHAAMIERLAQDMPSEEAQEITLDGYEDVKLE